MEAIGVFGPRLGLNLTFPSQPNLFPACDLYRFPVTSNPRKLARFVPLKATANTLTCEDENNRNFIKIGPSKWDHHSLFANLDFSVSLSFSLIRSHVFFLLYTWSMGV